MDVGIFWDGFYRFSFTTDLRGVGSFKQPKKLFLKAFWGFQLIVNLPSFIFLTFVALPPK